VLVEDRDLAELFERTQKLYANADKLSKRLVNELPAAAREAGLTLAEQKATPEQIAALLSLADGGQLSGPAMKEVLAQLVRSGGDPATIAQAKGLVQVSDQGETERAIDAIVARHPDELARYRSGKTALLGFFVGQVMKEMRGKGNPAVIGELLKKKL
jgi:aspartyl-tRNA(Asn)/glutamyl-tRNA(Gln) amidotransferase subunit B